MHYVWYFQHYKYESATYANSPSGPTSMVILFVHLNLMDPYAKGCIQWQLRILYSDSYAMNLVTWKSASQDCSPLYTNMRVWLLLKVWDKVYKLYDRGLATWRSYNLYTLSHVILMLVNLVQQWVLCSRSWSSSSQDMQSTYANKMKSL